jgi:uncharacterized membrane protein YidH (DUF202 family)
MGNSKTIAKVIGLILIVIGIALLYWGYQDSSAISAKVAKTFSGSEPNEIMYKYIGGAVSVVVGVYLLFRK